jgi:hypothetical protein
MSARSPATPAAISSPVSALTKLSVSDRGRERNRDPEPASSPVVKCINPVSDVNSRLDTQVEVRVYPCNNSQGMNGKKKCTTFNVKPEVSDTYWIHIDQRK